MNETVYKVVRTNAHYEHLKEYYRGVHRDIAETKALTLAKQNNYTQDFMVYNITNDTEHAFVLTERTKRIIKTLQGD